MPHCLLLLALSSAPLLSPFACLPWLPEPAPFRTSGFCSLSCPPGGSLLTHDALPLAFPILPPFPIAASAAHVDSAPPTCLSLAEAASLVMVTRRLLPCYAAGGVPVSAALLRTSPSACGTNQASGTHCCLSARSVSACLASAMCCCVPFAADRAAPATRVPPRASLLGAPTVWESVAPLSFRHRAPAAVLANACHRRSSLLVPVACRTGETRPRAILRAASLCPASATVPPSPYRVVSALVRIDCLRLLPLAPAVWSSPRATPPHGCRLDRPIPAAGSLTLRSPPGLSPCALPPAGFPPRPFPLIASHPPLPPPPPRPAFLVPLHLLPRPAPASVPGPPSPASPLHERRHCCSLPVRGVVLRILANDLSHRSAVCDLPASRTPLRRGGFRPPRQSRVRPLGATCFDPFLWRPLSHFLFDRPSWPGPDPRGRLVGVAIAPRTAHVPAMVHVAPALPHVG
ncbi:unnamed protein product [Closterium sp. NIES-54]